MAKSIVKEIIIILLLCLAIIVVLGLLLYEYVPMSKVVPEPVSYRTPEDVKEELIEVGEIDDSQVIMTYEINSSDLSNYERINDYNPGKANPFSSYQVNNDSENGETTSTTNGSISNNKNENNTTTSNNTSGGHYFKDKGTK